MYEYQCIVKRVIDGDTVVVDIDLGFEVWIHNQYVRLAGIDAPETRTRDLEEKAQGYISKDFVDKMLAEESIQILISTKYNGTKGKFGRIIGDFKVYDPSTDAETTLTRLMLKLGLAEEY